MGLNTGYLKADRTEESNEQYTPYYAVEPILKYIPDGTKVWTPFDREWSAFYQSFKARGGGGSSVVRSDISDGLDFFTYEPPEYDCIVSNPPFTQKDAVLKRLYELGKPFAVLLPLNSLQSVDRYKYFRQGIQILAFDKRIAFHSPQSMRDYKKGVSFATVYFCHDILPRDLIIEELKEYKKPLTAEREVQGIDSAGRFRNRESDCGWTCGRDRASLRRIERGGRMYGNLKRGEDTEQMGVIDWANWNTGRFPELKLLFHIPNGGKRDAREAARFKAMGVKAGVPDLCLPVPMNGFAGLYIEMKYGKNKPTDHQKEWIKALKEQGYKVTVCYSGIEATQELESYLQGVHTILSNPASEPCRPQKRMEIYCSGEDVDTLKAVLTEAAMRGECIFGGDFTPEDCGDGENSESCAACVLKNVSFAEYD